MSYSTHFRFALLLLSGGLFLASLTHPAFYLAQPDRDAWSDSLSLLLFGWMGFLGGSWESLLWWANPLYFYSLFLLARGRQRARWTASAAALLAALFSTFDTILASESGARARVASLEWGYYLWATSLVILAVGCLGYFGLSNRQTRARPPFH